MLIPREVAFDNNGKAICAGTPAYHYRPNTKVVQLPSQHYDFIDFDVKGKTLEEIEKEVQGA